uniref:DnaJ homolog subfamily C member 22 n=1 Tax=Macrostomum lignano TaxID=282301 RepID=A0A1I8GTJ2_9PLAT
MYAPGFDSYLSGCPLQASTLIVRMSAPGFDSFVRMSAPGFDSSCQDPLQTLTLLVRMSAPGFDSYCQDALTPIVRMSAPGFDSYCQGCPLQASTLIVRMSAPGFDSCLVRMSAPGFDSSCQHIPIIKMSTSTKLAAGSCPKQRSESAMASRTIAYILLFTLGLLGAHQFYLGRSLHGFVMLCSLGGFFAGWLHDLFNLERYIRESEDQFLTEEYQADLSRFTSVQQILQSAPAPGQPETQDRGRLRDDYESLEAAPGRVHIFPGQAARQGAQVQLVQILFGLTCAMLWLGAFPTEWFDDDNRKQLIRLTWPLPIALESDELALTVEEVRFVIELLSPLAMAIGVYLVGNIGVHQMSFTKLAICSYCSFVVYSTDFNNILYGSLLTVSLANWFCRDWRSRPAKPKSRCGRACAVSLGACLFYSLLAFSLLNNARVTYEGESVPLREAVRNFFKSPLWREMRDTIHGFKEILKQLWDALDPQGLKDAASIIGIKEGAGPDEIRSRCRKLKVELHPDRQQDPDKKAEFQAKFQDVSAACDILLGRKRASRKET